MLLIASSTPEPVEGLTVSPHAEGDEQRDRGRLAVELDTRDRAVEDQPHDRLLPERPHVPGVPVALDLAPGAADHIFADRPGKHRSQRAPYPAGVGPGKIGAGDQRVGCLGAPLVGAQRHALPFARPAVLADQSSPRHGDPRLAERAGQRPLTAAVTRAYDQWHAVIFTRLAPAVARARQRAGELLLQHRLDEAAHPRTDPILDRVEPIVK